MAETTPATEPAAAPVDEAALIASMGAPEEGEFRSEAPPPPQDASTEGEPQAEEAAAEPEAEPEPDDPPPEFWSAERKAIWPTLNAEQKQAVREQYEEGNRATAKKIEEAAIARKAAEEQAAKFRADQEQLASWWAVNGQSFVQNFQNRWAGVDWVKLAAEDPARCQQLRMQAEAEAAQLSQAQQQAQQARQQSTQRMQVEEQQARAAEHGKLASKFPREFGTPEVAQKTYGELSKFLADNGIPAERIAGIYEAPVVEIVRMAYAYKQLQAKASTVTKSAPPVNTVSNTPRRIAPGPARNPGNQGSDAERQAVERLKNGDTSEAVMRLAFR